LTSSCLSETASGVAGTAGTTGLALAMTYTS